MNVGREGFNTEMMVDTFPFGFAWKLRVFPIFLFWQILFQAIFKIHVRVVGSSIAEEKNWTPPEDVVINIAPDNCFKTKKSRSQSLWSVQRRLRRLQASMLFYNIWGFPNGWGYPNSWMVLFHPQKWMITRGTPMTKRKPPSSYRFISRNPTASTTRDSRTWHHYRYRKRYIGIHAK